MNLFKRGCFFGTLPLLFSCCDFSCMSIIKRDGKVAYSIINENNPSEHKYCVEIIVAPKGHLTINCSTTYAKINCERVDCIGFASSWVYYNNQYYYGGIIKEESVDNSNTIYALFDQDVNNHRIYCLSSQVKIS